MKCQLKSRYPASSAVVMKMFTDKAFHTDKLKGLGYNSYEVLSHSFDGKDFRIEVLRKVPIQFPGFSRGAGESTVVNEESWNLASKTGRVVLNVKGMPLEASCITRMTDEGKDCVVTFDWDVKAKIPLVGGTLEKFVVKDMEKKADEETQAAIALLKNYR